MACEGLQVRGRGPYVPSPASLHGRTLTRVEPAERSDDPVADSGGVGAHARAATAGDEMARYGASSGCRGRLSPVSAPHRVRHGPLPNVRSELGSASIRTSLCRTSLLRICLDDPACVLKRRSRRAPVVIMASDPRHKLIAGTVGCRRTVEPWPVAVCGGDASDRDVQPPGELVSLCGVQERPEVATCGADGLTHRPSRQHRRVGRDGDRSTVGGCVCMVVLAHHLDLEREDIQLQRLSFRPEGHSVVADNRTPGRGRTCAASAFPRAMRSP